MTAWHPLRRDDGTLRGYTRFQNGARLVVSADGAWSIHQLDGRRIVCDRADGAAAGIEAADDYAAGLWGPPARQGVDP